MKDRTLQNYDTNKASNVKLVEQLLECGASWKINNSNKGQTLLHVAAKLGYKEVCAILVDHGANLEEGDREGNTPLLLATKLGHSNTVSTLLERGVDINACDKQGLKPLHVAAKMGYTEVCVALIFEAGLEDEDQDGNTPLILATKGCHSSTCLLYTSDAADE